MDAESSGHPEDVSHLCLLRKDLKRFFCGCGSWDFHFSGVDDVYECDDCGSWYEQTQGKK